MSATSAAFNATATFEPTISPNSVLISGTATNSSDIANIQLFDGATEIGSTGQFSGSQWGLVEAIAPGQHVFHIVVTTLSGSPVPQTVYSPYQLVTGIQNQPYVFQELDENSSGVVTRVSNYDASGTLVSQTAVATNGKAATAFSVAFDPTATFVGTTEAVLSGTNSAVGSAGSIEIFDGPASGVVNPQTGAVTAGAQALGYATINNDGSWSFDAHVSSGTHTFTAVATSIDGRVADAQSAFTLVTGVVGSPYVYQEFDHAATGAVAAVTSYAADGSVVQRSVSGGASINGGTSNGNVIRSSYQDVMTGDGGGSTTFAFRRGFGQDEITNFNYLSAAASPTGVEHDVLSLPQSAFHTVGQVLAHTTSALDGDAVIHLSRTDSIKIDGVTKADLLTHPNVFGFHA